MLNKKIKILIISLTILLLFLVVLPLFIWLYALPLIVENQSFLKYVQKTVKETCGAELILDKPILKTSPKLSLNFNSNNILLTKNGKTLLSIDNLDSNISLQKILAKKIILNKLGADDIYVDINEIQQLTTKEAEEPKPFEYKIRWFNSNLYLKNCTVLYRTEDDVLVKFFAKDLEITKQKNPKYIHFKILTDIEYDNKKFRLLFRDFDKIYFKDKKINIDNFQFIVDKSIVNINGFINKDNKYDIKISSKNFQVKSVEQIMNSNLVIANGREILSCFKDMNGDFDFNFNLTNKSMSGEVKANKISAKLVPLANIPFTMTKGFLEMNSKNIVLKDIEGYYGSSISNKILMSGNVEDYVKSAKTSIIIQGDAKDEFANYVSKLAGCKFKLIGTSKIAIKVDTDISGKVTVGGGFKIPKGSDLLIEGASISPTKFDRALGIKLNMFKDILDIEHINYYISNVIEEKNRPTTKPLISLKSNVNIQTGQINKLAFDIPNPLPSEFFNVLINQRLFRRGTFSGNLEYVNTDKFQPFINSNLVLKDVMVVGQGLSIKEAYIKASNKQNIHIEANGRLRRTNYKFDSDIKNRILFPIIIKNINLNFDNLDVERVMATFAPRPELTEEQRKVFRERMKTRQQQLAKSDVPLQYFEINETVKEKTKTIDEENAQITFEPNLIAIESCNFNVKKGQYKQINFGNLHANLTLTEKGILQIQSNKFDFAEGISTLKVYCDMVKQKYSVRLGAKDVDSDVIATSILNLPREISGKASALLEFNTDEKMKLNGQIQFEIKEGSIMKLGLVQYILNMASIFRNPVAMISPTTLMDLVNVPDGTFKNISGDLKIKDNVINRMIIKSSSPQLSSLIFGQMNLETFDSSLRIYTKFSNKNKGLAGFMRNLSLNSLARKNQLNAEDISYYAAELKMLPKLETSEELAQVFLTIFDGDVQSNNFISSLKKIK